MSGTCEHCLYCAKVTQQLTERLQCRFYPPHPETSAAIGPMRTQAVFPEVLPDMWCREYLSRPA